MSAHTIFLLLLTGLAAGILSGLIGVGGGILIVPALVLIFGFSQKEAQGTSLSILLLLTGIFSVFEFYQQGRVKLSYAIIVAIAFFIGNYIGGTFSFNLSEQKLKRVFAVTMMLLSIRMLFFERHKKRLPPSTNTASSSSVAKLE